MVKSPLVKPAQLMTDYDLDDGPVLYRNPLMTKGVLEPEPLSDWDLPSDGNGPFYPKTPPAPSPVDIENKVFICTALCGMQA